ncbi:hypothetical protein BDW60DRAFT_202078 [Aspergillus nidulans var. acristatus]
MENKQSVTTTSGNGLVSTPLPQFPPLPQDFYSPHPENVISAHISTPPSRWNDVNDALQLAWAIILANQTNSPDVIYGVSYNGWDMDSKEHALIPFRWLVKPENTIKDELASIATQRVELQTKQNDHHGALHLNLRNPEHVIGSQFRNLLVIWNADEISELQPDFAPYIEDYALSVHCEVKSGGVQARARFDAVVIPKTEVQMLLMQLTDILQMIYSPLPAVMVKDLQQIGPEGMKMVSKWNLQVQAGEENVCIHDMIEQKFKDIPDAAAVSAFDGSLTYRELDTLSSRLSAQLIRKGMRPGTFAGIYLSKSMLAIVSMVAVIRAGGAFVFLPPSLPSLRLKVMSEGTPVDLVLTVESLLDHAYQLGPRVCVVGGAEKDTEVGLWNPPAVKPNDPLYAIYTSGTTGEPKGIMVDRASFGPGARQFIDRFCLRPGCRVFQSVSYAFVVSIIEQLMALASGSCICVPSEEEQQNNIEAAIGRARATLAIMTPSVARSLSPLNLTNLKGLILAGEPVTQSDVKQWRGHVRLYSLYGQSETGSSLLIEDLSGSPDNYGLGTITTGACWIVSPEDHTRLAPIGCEGELMIESMALATEYLNNTEESAKTFIPMPRLLQSLRPHDYKARCLLTGDIVRYSDNEGTIRLVGRKGTGVKIRGQRIELGEIECQLRPQFPEASHVIVEAIQPAGREEGQTILVGFVAGFAEDLPTNARRAIAKLRQILPSFMIPSAIVPLTEVPTTATGKVHRKALRERMASLTLSDIMGHNQQKRKGYRAPVTNNEIILQAMVEDLLCLPRFTVGLDESFFDAGGDSLTARQLVAKARSHGLALTVAAVFEDPRLFTLAACMGEVNDGNGTIRDSDPFQMLREDFLRTVPSFLRASIEDVYPTMGVATRTVHERRVDYFPFLLKGPLNRGQFRKACEAFIRAIPVMRSVFVPFHDQVLQVTLRGIATPYQELTVPEGEDALSWTRSFISEEQKLDHSFNHPVVEFTLIRKNTEEHVFVLRLPHAIYDGGCLQQIGKELSAAYNGEILPLATATFSDYTRTAARLFTPQAVSFWSELVAGSEITCLPRASEGEEAISIYPGEISTPSPPSGITMATAIKAAWAWVLHEETGKMDILYGQVRSTRGIVLPSGTGSDVIGCCLNITPVRVRFDKLKATGGTVQELFEMVHRQHVQGFPHETVNWSDVIAQGATWPDGTDFDSIVLHENFGSLPVLQFGEMIGEMIGEIVESAFHLIPSDQHMLVTWPGEGRLSAFLMTRTGMLGGKYAERLVGLFGQTLATFLDFPEASLFSRVGKAP